LPTEELLPDCDRKGGEVWLLIAYVFCRLKQLRQ
jgi:hypothetical protein